MYAFYFLLVTIICVIMMSPTVEQEMRDHVSTYSIRCITPRTHAFKIEEAAQYTLDKGALRNVCLFFCYYY